MSYVNALLNFLKSSMIILFLFPTGCQKGGDSGPEQGRCVARRLCRERPGRCQGLPDFHTFDKYVQITTPFFWGEFFFGVM